MLGEAEPMGVSLFTAADLGVLWGLKRFDRDGSDTGYPHQRMGR